MLEVTGLYVARVYVHVKKHTENPGHTRQKERHCVHTSEKNSVRSISHKPSGCLIRLPLQKEKRRTLKIPAFLFKRLQGLGDTQHNQNLTFMQLH